MATALDLFPQRVALIDIKTGRLTQEGYRAFATLFERVGGSSAPSNSELAVSDDDDSGLEEFKAELSKTLDGLGMNPAVVLDPFTDPLHGIVQEHSPLQEVLTELAGLREEVAVLRTQINDIQQGAIL